MCGPTGIGFLFGKSDLLSAMPPFLGKFLYSKQFCICVYDSYDADGNLRVVSNFFFFPPNLYRWRRNDFRRFFRSFNFCRSSIQVGGFI